MIQKEFANHAKKLLMEDQNVIGLAVGGSWLSDELDEFSDLDLILVTKEKISDKKSEMLGYANRIGKLLTGFTGEHVGEPRVLICLYDNPLLHVDIKFLTLDELATRVEDPHILFDRDNQLLQAFQKSEAMFPYPDYQWIEDRFWIWIHYTLLKVGRGEYMEAIDFFGFMRMVVLGPLLHIKNGNLLRAVRKVETTLKTEDLNNIKLTLPYYDRQSILAALKNAIDLYKSLRTELFDHKIDLKEETEEKVMNYLTKIKNA
ncbi:nucleotidyltransferase domain-containing protein [Catalinimonas niigatensis]|uniref:nucleotidyltransferase domain-containing protein n=1 Tax=Catalinimonas niigatensis TaxID=1397264 RepID=UPI002666FA2A|nr:nucleotidyltransferase domain-containing protein [Catalinimonas niigatensis]WPP52171.1 nucleotidyltransferase domain-containing protein [Catalinimonas niigatensis]